MAKENYYKTFEKLRDKECKKVKGVYLSHMEKGDKEFVYHEFEREIVRKRFEKLQQLLGEHQRILLEIEKKQKWNLSIPVEKFFNEKFKLIEPKARKKVLELFSEYDGLLQFYKFWHDEGISYIEESEPEMEGEEISPFTWLGENETEFVQFVYGMFGARCKGQITKLVPQMAKLLNFQLGEFWQTNHTDSIHNRKPEYKVEIFNIMNTAYTAYCTKLINKKKQNTTSSNPSSGKS